MKIRNEKWRMVKLGDIFKISSGGTPLKSKPEYYENGTIQWVRTGDLKDKYITKVEGLITEEALNNSSAKLFPVDTVLIAMYGATIGACSILSVEAATNQACAAFLPNKEVESSYLYYFLCNMKNDFVKMGVGGAQPNISATILKGVKIHLPPLETQKRITKTLDTAAELLAMRNQQLAELDNLIKSTFYDMFGDPFENPKGWNKCKLSDLAIIIMGQSPNGNSYNEEGEGTPLLNGPTEFGKKYPTERQWTLEPTKMCKKEDILFCVRGATAGRMNISNKEYCIGRGLAAIRPIQSNMQSFIYLYLKMMYSYFQSTSNGSTFINISKDQLHKLPFLKVDTEIQEQFSRIALNIEENKTLVQRAIEETQYLFDSLMSEYFE